jgi:restriction system protein
MSSSIKRDRPRTKARPGLAGKGLAALVIGVLLLTVIPNMMRSQLGPTIAQVLRPAGWVALMLGAVMLVLNFFVQRSNQAPPTEEPQRPVMPSTAPLSKKLAARKPATEPVAPPAPVGVRQQASWNPAVLADIEWRRFEAVCEAFYAQAGLTTRSQSHGADGGVDIWLESQHMDQPRIVQCKHWQGKPVGVKEMREFLGVMTANKLRHGTFVTSSTFTADALAFAADNGIHLQDGAALLKLIGQRTPEQQAALLAVAYEGEYWRPTCASCGTKMVERTSGKFARPFWGCANYPTCRGRAITKARVSTV